VALAVITCQRGVLLGRRADGNPPWVFPGGKIEPGETAEAATAREALEETGLRVRPVGVICSREHPATGVSVIYVAAVLASSHGSARPGRELTELRWVTLTEAERLTEGAMSGSVRDCLERALGIT
jgi:8-oxo-dGTP diphosphatase